MTDADMKYYRAVGDDGGTIGTTEIVDGQIGNLFPDVNATEAEAGNTDYRKFFVKNTHASDSAVNVLVAVVAFTPGDDHVNIFPGTADDTTANFTNTTLYGTAKATAELDRNTKVVSVVLDGQQAVADLFRAGDTIIFVNASDYTRLATATVASTDASTITINEDIPADITLNGSMVANTIGVTPLAAGDSFPVWVQRVVPAYSAAMEDPADSFVIATYFDG